MRNTLADLNNALFAEIESLQDDSLDMDKLEVVIKRSNAVSNIAEKIIKNADLALRTVEVMNEYGYDIKGSRSEMAQIPEMLLPK